jgi:hypothetical protein
VNERWIPRGCSQASCSDWQRWRWQIVRTSSELSQARERLILAHPRCCPRRTRTESIWLVFHDVLLFATEDEFLTTYSRPNHWWAIRLRENIPSPELIIESFLPSSLEPTLGTGRNLATHQTAGNLRPNYFQLSPKTRFFVRDVSWIQCSQSCIRG